MTLKDITCMLEEGLKRDVGSPVVVEEAPYTYPIKERTWENWFPFAYLAFQRLNQARVRSFATIGVGSGADALGALHAFNLDTLVITDIDERVVSLAERNVRRYGRKVNLVSGVGSLCQPLRDNALTVDLIYENLPNIPDRRESMTGCQESSRYKAGSFESCDKKNERAKAYLLESHATFLMETKESLNVGGSALCSIGGRVPYDLLRNLVISAGYHFEELVAGFKVQTEPEEILWGYADAETGEISFDFYRYDEAVDFLREKGMKEPFVELSGGRLKRILEPYRISAQEALKLYQQQPPCKIGHTVHMIRALKI